MCARVSARRVARCEDIILLSVVPGGGRCAGRMRTTDTASLGVLSSRCSAGAAERQKISRVAVHRVPRLSVGGVRVVEGDQHEMTDQIGVAAQWKGARSNGRKASHRRRLNRGHDCLGNRPSNAASQATVDAMLHAEAPSRDTVVRGLWCSTSRRTCAMAGA